MRAGRELPSGEETLWPAPAKLNLFLHVVGRRADGYHELQTAFQLIDFCDTLAIALRSDGSIERPEGPAGVPAEADLVVRAARALQARAGVHAGASIRVLKRIPMGGGLGGGSSDAATALLALNEVWGCGLSLRELGRLGLPLGADVPVFVEGFSAWGEGVGERLVPLELPERHYVVIDPRVPISTREVFQAPDLTRNSPLITIPTFFACGGHNDCEPVVRRRYPQVARALDWLGARAQSALTGTGCCVFAACADAAEAQAIAAQVPAEWGRFVARGVRESPMHARLREVRAGRG